MSHKQQIRSALIAQTYAFLDCLEPRGADKRGRGGCARQCRGRRASGSGGQKSSAALSERGKAR
eukprot:5001194-Pleurochrysis_carterae.AAC.1